MRIFRVRDPVDMRFAQAGTVGTWVSLHSTACPECGASRQRRVPPLVIEWLPDSDVVADFTWSGAGGDIVVTQRVRESLEEQHLVGFEFRDVEMWQNPKLQRPRRVTKRTKPRVWLPYEGPPLYELWVTVWVHTDLGRSSVRLVRACATCGTEFYELTGIEVRERRWDPAKKDLVAAHRPREKRKGIYLQRKDLENADIFQLYEFPGWIFCVERVKTLIEERSFTNTLFLEMGEVFG
jgi:hypothetical protein